MVNLQIKETLTGTIDFALKWKCLCKCGGTWTKDIFIHQKNVKDALQGDKVLIITYNFKGRKLEGSVLEVLERAKDSFVGTFEYVKYKDFGFVICDKKVINTDIFIPKSKIHGAKRWAIK